MPRTRDRLPVLPVLVRSVGEHRHLAARLLDAARRTSSGERFHVAGKTLIRADARQAAPGRIGAEDPDSGKRRDLSREEERAFCERGGRIRPRHRRRRATVRGADLLQGPTPRAGQEDDPWHDGVEALIIPLRERFRTGPTPTSG
jgi:hypothetical protein